MPKALRLVIRNMASGFLLGATTALVIVVVEPDAVGHGHSIQPLSLVMQIYAFGASFALGSLATALMGKFD